MSKAILMFSALLGVGCLFVGRAVLAYNGGPSICLMPPNIVSTKERIENVVRHFREHPNIQHPDLSHMDPRTCCRIGDRSSTERPVTFWTVLTEGRGEVVATNVRGAITGEPLNVLTDLCGNPHTW